MHSLPEIEPAAKSPSPPRGYRALKTPPFSGFYRPLAGLAAVDPLAGEWKRKLPPPTPVRLAYAVTIDPKSEASFAPLAVGMVPVAGSEVPSISPSSTTGPRPLLVPSETPFVEGQRYRPAGVIDPFTRLDLYVSDSAGPWLRLHGVLIAEPPMV